MACKAEWQTGSWKGMICGYPLEASYHEITNSLFNHGYEEGDPSKMTTTTSTVPAAPADPTMGVPVAGPAKPKRTPKATAPTSIATARATKKRRKLTGEQWKEQRAFAQKTTGYNETSPIWGRRLIEVLVDIEALLDFGTPNAITSQKERVERALLYNRELQKRLATNQLTNIS